MDNTAQHSLRGHGLVHRRKVEEIGDDLGMAKIVACEQFLPFRGSLWDVYADSLAFSMAEPAETKLLELARRWLAINDVNRLRTLSKGAGRGPRVEVLKVFLSDTDKTATAQERNKDAN